MDITVVVHHNGGLGAEKTTCLGIIVWADACNTDWAIHAYIWLALWVIVDGDDAGFSGEFKVRGLGGAGFGLTFDAFALLRYNLGVGQR